MNGEEVMRQARSCYIVGELRTENLEPNVKLTTSGQNTRDINSNWFRRDLSEDKFRNRERYREAHGGCVGLSR